MLGLRRAVHKDLRVVLQAGAGLGLGNESKSRIIESRNARDFRNLPEDRIDALLSLPPLLTHLRQMQRAAYHAAAYALTLTYIRTHTSTCTRANTCICDERLDAVAFVCSRGSPIAP